MRLEFHTDLADPLGYSCRLLRKAYRQGLRAVVCGDPERLSRLDTLLWTFEQLEFIPHARLRAGERPDATLLARTPIWLADAAAAWPDAPVVVNLGDPPVAEPTRFERIVELVGDAEADLLAGRARWRHYVSLGLKPERAGHAAAATAADGDATATP